MEYIEYKGKTVDDAITEACQALTVTSDKLEYEVVEKGSAGILGFGSKPAVIKARVKVEKAEKADKKEEKKEDKKEKKQTKVDATSEKKNDKAENKTIKSEEKSSRKEFKADKNSTVEPAADPKEFLEKVFKAMDMNVNIEVVKEGNEINIELSGDDMGVLIGKRGQTLDSLQYLTSLVVNKGIAEYIRVKVDTEDYRKRRKDTLENLAKNLAYKVKRTKKPVSLEPMNPYERRVIHSTLQNDKYVSTHSEGEEPYRKVVITLNKQ